MSLFLTSDKFTIIIIGIIIFGICDFVLTSKLFVKEQELCIEHMFPERFEFLSFIKKFHLQKRKSHKGKEFKGSNQIIKLVKKI